MGESDRTLFFFFKIPFRERLDGGTVPPDKTHARGTVPRIKRTPEALSRQIKPNPYKFNPGGLSKKMLRLRDKMSYYFSVLETIWNLRRFRFPKTPNP